MRSTEEGSVPILPFEMMIEIVIKTHLQLGHIGLLKLLNIIKGKFWHPGLQKICRDICVCCAHCQVNKVHRIHLQPPTVKIQTRYPFQLVAVDVMLLPKSKKGNVAVLVAVDLFSKFLMVIPMRNKTGVTVTNKLSQVILPS